MASESPGLFFIQEGRCTLRPCLRLGKYLPLRSAAALQPSAGRCDVRHGVLHRAVAVGSFHAGRGAADRRAVHSRAAIGSSLAAAGLRRCEFLTAHIDCAAQGRGTIRCEIYTGTVARMLSNLGTTIGVTCYTEPCRCTFCEVPRTSGLVETGSTMTPSIRSSTTIAILAPGRGLLVAFFAASPD
jgi:hypothetical protein